MQSATDTSFWLTTGMEGYRAFQNLFQQEFKTMKKTRGKDKQPRKKPSVPSTPLQRAQRDRQSILFPISGAVGNLRYNLERMNNNKLLFTPAEYEAGKKLYMALEEWFIAHNHDENAWEKVKENLANSAEKPQEIV